MADSSTESDTYTHGHHASVLRSHTWRTVANSAAYLTPHLQAGRSVLDVGCGPGTLTADLAAHVSPGPVIGMDFAAEIIASATADHASNGDGATLSFETGDVYDMNYADDRFDIVHAHQVLQHLSDPVAALREMGRVAVPGGMVAVRDADYRAMTWYPAIPALEDWMTLYQAVARRNDAEPNAGRHLLAWARAAGFADPTPTASVWCFATDTDREWWGGLWAERIVSSSLAEQAVEYGLATENDLERLSQAWRQWAAHPDAWFTVLNGELILPV